MFSDTAVMEDRAATVPEWPSEIRIDRKGRTLELSWGAHSALLSHRVLRRSCRCSECESVRRRTNAVLPVARDVELLKVEQVGSVGLQLFFSDGHSRGIYPWVYLEQIAFGTAMPGFSESLMKGWRDE